MLNKIETVALLHPGKMGVTIGTAAATGGARIVWASDGRGNATRRRAEQAKLIDVEKVAAAVRQSDVVLSVCPPHAAVDLASAVASRRSATSELSNSRSAHRSRKQAPRGSTSPETALRKSPHFLAAACSMHARSVRRRAQLRP